MYRLALVGALTASVLVAGCTARQPTSPLPGGEELDRLVAAIAARGRGEGPPEPDPPRLDRRTTGDRVAFALTAAWAACVACAVIPLYVLYGVAPRA
jgi:hypothetical protein